MPSDRGTTRRDLLSRGAALAASAVVVSASPRPADARDYATRHEALDELDRLASICGLRLQAVRESRSGTEVLVSRFLRALEKHRATREEVRRRFGLPKGVAASASLETVDADLAGLRQSLDDLMVAYAECLPVFGDAAVVSRLAVDMVDVSRLRTVIDLWAEAEAA
jgi:hypothetical protein